MRFPLGQPVRLSTTVTQLNLDGTTTLVNPGSLTLVVQQQNADTTTTITGTYVITVPSADGTGLFHQDIPVTDIDDIAHYQYTWTSTGAGAGVSFGDFDVFDPFETAILPLADAKDMLNIPQATTTSDSRLQSLIATIEGSIETFTGGPLINRTVTERVVLDDSYTVLIVRQRPLVSVTSITSVASGIALDISAGLDIDPVAGTIRRKLGYPFYGPFFIWLPAMSVTYIAGWGTTIPAAFTQAAEIILAHLWQSRRGAASPPMMGGEETVALPGWGYAIPNRAAELLQGGSQNGIPFVSEAYV